MFRSKLAAALVVGLSILAFVGTLVTLVLTTLQSATLVATVVVLALVVLAVVGASAVGARSRRWLSNPYW